MKKITLLVLLCAFCLPLSAQTYLQENFDAETLPTGWTVTDEGDNTGDTWKPGNRGGNTLDGTNAAIVDSDADGNGPHLIETLTSPEFDSSGATFLYLDFNQYFRSIGDDLAQVEVFDGSDWVIVLSQTGGNVGSFENPDNQHINITDYKNENMRVRFYYNDNDIWAWYWLVDNVAVYNETCGSPSSLSVNDITQTSAVISWTPAGDEPDWEIVVQIADSGVPSGSGTVTTTNSYDATGLTLITDYEVYVRGNCGGSDGYSVWAGPLFFTTLDTPPPPAPVSFTMQSLSTSGSNRAVVDMNGDYLDDVVSISSTNVNIQFQNPANDSGFTEINITTPNAAFLPGWSLAAGDYNADGYTDLLYGSGSGVTFMKAVVDSGNTGNANPFDDITAYEEFSVANYVFSQRSNFVDVNNDGHLDAFVCHDVEPNVYYLNDGSGNLTFYQTTFDAPYNLGDYSSGGNYGSIWIDYDNDHDLDMFIAKCGGSEARRTNQMHTNDGLFESDNTTISYTENAADIGLNDPMQTWSSAWGDFDNDGDMDVFVGASSGSHKLMQNDMNTSGNFTDITSGSGVSTLTATGIENQTYDFDNDGNLDIFSNGNILFGHGDMTFDVYTSTLPGSGSFGDLNNDGFIDAFSGNVYRNNTNDNNWIKINTVGGASGGMSNINGIGARVELHSSGDRIQIRDVRSGEGFRYMSTLNTHFGIGTDTAIDQIVVYWPSGIIDIIDNPNINETLTVTEGQTLSVEDEELTDVVIYPNPVQDILNISTAANLTNRVASVFDINGKRVINQKLTNSTLKVSTLQSGVYILRLEANGKVMNRKFIKE